MQTFSENTVFDRLLVLETFYGIVGKLLSYGNLKGKLRFYGNIKCLISVNLQNQICLKAV